HSDLVTLETSRVTFDRFHERASFTLIGSAAFPKAAAAQSCLELAYRLGAGSIIMSGKVVSVQRKVGLDSLQTRDDACQDAHVFSETCDCRRRGNDPISAARHD